MTDYPRSLAGEVIENDVDEARDQLGLEISLLQDVQTAFKTNGWLRIAGMIHQQVEPLRNWLEGDVCTDIAKIADARGQIKAYRWLLSLPDEVSRELTVKLQEIGELDEEEEPNE